MASVWPPEWHEERAAVPIGTRKNITLYDPGPLEQIGQRGVNHCRAVIAEIFARKAVLSCRYVKPLR